MQPLSRSRRSVPCRTRRVLVGVLLSLLSTTGAGALRGQSLQFRHIGTEHGLANSMVLDVVRDSKGFMWFGTRTGLNRYDGYTMSTHRHVVGDSTSLSDDVVNALYEDEDGGLWIGTRRGLSLYDRASDSFRNYLLQEDVELAKQWQVLEIAGDGQGGLWLGTYAGLFRFDPASGDVEWVKLPTRKGEFSPVIQDLLSMENGELWIGTAADGLMMLDSRTETVRQYAPGGEADYDFPSASVNVVVRDSTGRIWVGSAGDGVIMLDPRTGRTRQYRHDPSDSNSLSADAVLSLALDGSGGLWIGTENGGLDHFDPGTGIFEHNRPNPNSPSGLNGSSIWTLFRDHRNTLWVGTFVGGLNVLRHSGGALRHYVPTLGEFSGTVLNSVLSFAQDSTGLLWVAVDGGGLASLDPQSGEIRSYTTTNSDLSKDAVLAVGAEDDGTLWVGTWAGGLNRFDRRTGRFRAYTTANSDIPDDNIFSLCVDRHGRIWLGTFHAGLVLFDPDTETFTTYPLPLETDVPLIWILEELRDGRLLIGTSESGVLVFDPATEEVTRYIGDENDPDALRSSAVGGLAEGPSGTVWVGTPAGLDRIDLATGRVAHLGKAHGLPEGIIHGVRMDQAGNLWLGTDSGLARWDPRAREHRLYTAADGLGKDYNPRASFRSREGLLLFGGTTGFDVIDPGAVRANPHPPPVVFTGFQLFNRPVPIGGEKSPLSAPISETEALTLDYDQSVFTIEFAALDFLAPEANDYAYMLEGFDRDWTYSGDTRRATYTNLPPGDYTFHVKASNNDGVWNHEGAALAITITPPVWGTWWFRLLVVLVVGGTVAGVVGNARRRHRYLRRNVRSMLDAMQRFSTGDYSVSLDVHGDDEIGKLRQGFNNVVADRKRTEEELRQSQKMEAVGRLAGGVAHDFNNLLTVIRGNTVLALDEVQDNPNAREELEEIQQAADRAATLTRQLLTFSRKEILQPRVLSLNAVVGDVGRMLHRTVGEDVILHITLDPELGSVRADQGQIEQMLLNLVVNARDAMPQGGHLYIQTRGVTAEQANASSPGLYGALTVRDTGTGMTKEVKERIFEPFFTTKKTGDGTGLGLSTVYGIVEQSGGSVEVESEPGRGTTFTAYLPLVDRSDEASDDSPAVEPACHSSATVLLVEDEDGVRRLARRVLEREGHTIVEAADGMEALALAERHVGDIDLLLTDVIMPGMSGREVAERLLPLHRGMRLLYSSGYTEDEIVRHGVSSQGTAFLEKPFTPAELARKVRQVLESDRVGDGIENSTIESA